MAAVVAERAILQEADKELAMLMKEHNCAQHWDVCKSCCKVMPLSVLGWCAPTA